MSVKTKIVDVQGKQYQVRKLRPNIGSFIITRVMAAGVGTSSVEDDDDAPDKKLLVSMFSAFLKGIDFDTFSFIQNNCLAVVSRMEPAPDGQLLPMPITTDTGVFAALDVADDLSLVMSLTIESLLFNLSDFFDGGGLKTVAGIQK